MVLFYLHAWLFCVGCLRVFALVVLVCCLALLGCVCCWFKRTRCWCDLFDLFVDIVCCVCWLFVTSIVLTVFCVDCFWFVGFVCVLCCVMRLFLFAIAYCLVVVLSWFMVILVLSGYTFCV